MTLEEAKTLLDACKRRELRDHYFGDAEVGWYDASGNEVAGGYFGGSGQTIWFSAGPGFKDKDARALRFCGVLDVVERNDETGPDQYGGR